MPEKKEIIPVMGKDMDSILSIAYGTFENLGWNIRSATENTLTGFTPRKWNVNEQRIVITASNNQLEISSKMILGESFDLAGKNKKNIRRFSSVFDLIKTSGTEVDINSWKTMIAELREKTILDTKEQIHLAKEVDKVMRLSKGGIKLTLGIIAINVLLFIAMIASGVNLFAPTGTDVIKWGANFAPLTFSGEGWRLITCAFVHVGIIHIAFNMYALFIIGVYLEPMLGKVKYGLAYLCTGFFASIASLWWHELPVPSAGASGAIFGMYGVFLALLSTNLIPREVRSGLLKSIVIFIAYNLLYGLKDNIDNSAHIGGLLSGIGIGYGYYFMLKPKRPLVARQAATAITMACTLLVGLFCYSVVRIVSLQRMAFQQFQLQLKNITSQADTSSSQIDVPLTVVSKTLSSHLLQKMDDSLSKQGGDDFKEFKKLLDEFLPLESEAITIYDEPASKTLNERIERVRSHCLATWKKGARQFKDAASWRLSPELENMRKDLVRYCKLEQRKADLLIKFYSEPYEDYSEQMNEADRQIELFIAKVW